MMLMESTNTPSHQTPLLILVWLTDDRADQGDAAQIVESMLHHAWGPFGTNALVGGNSESAWGLLLPEKYGPLTCWSVFQTEHEICVVEGDFYDDLPGLKLAPGNNPGIAEYAAAHLRKNPQQQLPYLNGVFSGFYFDRRSSAVVFSDGTGTRPVYWLSGRGRFIVTGNLWAFRGCKDFSRRWDTMALGQMLTLGVPLAGRTWLEGVKHLQRGRVVRAFADGRSYQKMVVEPIQRQSCSLKQSVRLLRDTLDQTIKGLSDRAGQTVGIGMSGGLDSRLLLASLSTQGIHHKGFTFLGPHESDDQALARNAAELMGTQHRTIVLNGQARGNISDYRLINEGESGAAGFIDMAALARQDVGTLMVGYAGDVFAGAPVGPFQPLRTKNKQELSTQLLRVYMNLFSYGHIRQLLDKSFCPPWQDVMDEWDESFDQIDQSTIMDAYLDHILDYRLQRRTRPRIDQIRWYCQPLYPYVDNRVYSAYRSLPLPHLDGEQAHLALLESYGTGLENLPSAQRRFVGVPLKHEYRLRHAIHLGRVLRSKFVLPLQNKFKELRGLIGCQRFQINGPLESEINKLKQCPVVNWNAVEKLVSNVEHRTFWNINALRQLANVQVIHSFLFEDGLCEVGALEMLPSTRTIHCIPHQQVSHNLS